MRKSVLLVAVMVALGLCVSSAQAGLGPQDPKKTEKAPASVAGNWNMSVNGPQGPMSVTMALAQEGKKLTGTLSSQMGETTLEGEFADGKISFWIVFDAGGGSSQIAFAGVLKEDGTLEGTLSGQMGDMNWTAERVKQG
jgi:hypothetical protein